MLEAARNVACAGGRPLAVTDCLNFGNPEKPEVAWELAEAIEGMALACEALGIPVVSGNVSLYNETDGRAIWPTPVVGCVGLVADVRLVPRTLARGRRDLRRRSARAHPRRIRVPGPLPRRPRRPSADCPTSRPKQRSIAFLWRAAPLLTAAHDAAEGGLAVALAELGLVVRYRGARRARG